MKGSGNIAALEQAILEQARQEASATLAAAQAKASSFRRQAEQEANADAEKILQRASEEAARLREQAVARARLEAQMLKLRRREQILAPAFEAARARLDAIFARADYVEIVQALIREAAGRLGASAGIVLVVLADARTRALLTPERLAALSDELGARLTLGEPLPQGTGVVLTTEDGHQRYDNTLEARLERAQSSLRATVYHTLVGDAG